MSGGVALLRAALGPSWHEALLEMASRPCDLFLRLLDGSFREYQRSAQRWWKAIEPNHLDVDGRPRPVYFVSSNSHSLANLLGGYAHVHKAQLLEFCRRVDPEGLAAPLDAAMAKGDDVTTWNILYYVLRAYLHDRTATDDRLAAVQQFDAESGVRTIMSPGKIDVDAQVIDLSRLRPDRVDPRGPRARDGAPGRETGAHPQHRLTARDGAYHH